jgi:uncharacterized protein (TIGR00375 family)
MNWHVPALDNITLISNSDAHSPQKLGREANVFAFEKESDITYDEIFRIIREGDKKKFLYTIEFYPEEGKYHYDGHRACNVSYHPEETKKHKGICPVCKKPLVIGVMNRVGELGDRSQMQAKKAGRIPYKSLVPLPEIIGDALGFGSQTKTVKKVYDALIDQIGSEFFILLHASLKDIVAASSKQIADAVDRVRKGNIYIKPGYDGEFGIVKVFADDDDHGGLKQVELDLD